MTATLALEPGERVAIPATLNSSAKEARVASVEPWMLTRGTYAGQQSRQGRRNTGAPLWRVVLTEATTVGPPLRPIREGSVDAMCDASATIHHAVTADHEWTVL